MNTNKNPNLPANAIACVAVKAGMSLIRDGKVAEIVSVRWMGHRGKVVLSDGRILTVNSAGTLRLA